LLNASRPPQQRPRLLQRARTPAEAGPTAPAGAPATPAPTRRHQITPAATTESPHQNSHERLGIGAKLSSYVLCCGRSTTVQFRRPVPFVPSVASPWRTSSHAATDVGETSRA